MTEAVSGNGQELVCEDIRTSSSVSAIKRDFLDNLAYMQGRFSAIASTNDNYMALAYTIRDRLLDHWIKTCESYYEKKSRTVCYLSAEFLMGPHLGNNIINLGIYDQVRAAMSELGLDLDVLLAQEEEPGLGNGGLGRLAACYLDSMATLEVPAIGYGLRYEFGIFDQEIRNGWQVEVTDKWLRHGNPWELGQSEISHEVKYGGHTQGWVDESGRYRVRWYPDRMVRGVGHDTPVLGYKVNTANLLRLWKAEACESFDFAAFNVGNYMGAVEAKIQSENITKVLYPNDDTMAGKRLRLEQQYFLVSCSLQDMIRIHRQRSSTLDDFHVKYVVQLNDTHPALAIPELMRLLVDEHLMDWDKAWAITTRTFAYTNHTLLPEALETWPLELFGSLLPRHLEIVLEINRRFLVEVRARFPGDEARVARLSLIDEYGGKSVRMANLAVVGSLAVNGVAELHTKLLKTEVLRDFHDLWPDKFGNKTNGVTPRRFLLLANRGLSGLITSRIGDEWVCNLDRLRELECYVEDAGFRAEWREVKQANKRLLAVLIAERTGIQVDVESLFDVQVKRIHEYKRQHLNILNVVAAYNRIKRDPAAPVLPRTFIFGGKAAPGYFMAKLIIKLINSVAETVNSDPDVGGRLKVVFFPDFNVKNAQLIYPAADLSEQISTAGKEASGTGNMKFALNGALTIGTLDGANVEIREEVGAENFFLFGLTVEELAVLRPNYRPVAQLERDAELREALDSVLAGRFSGGDGRLFHPLVDGLRWRDDFMVLADFASYRAARDEATALYSHVEEWTRRSIRTVARMGKFSSDRSIREYCADMWKVDPSPIRG